MERFEFYAVVIIGTLLGLLFPTLALYLFGVIL